MKVAVAKLMKKIITLMRKKETDSEVLLILDEIESMVGRL